MPPDLFAARESATALLLKQRLGALDIDVTKLRYEKSIVFDSMCHFCRVTRLTLEELEEGTGCLQDGCTLIRGTPPTYLVLYRETRGRRRRNFTLAHEVGHIYLGHRQDTDKEEAEANAFASQLLLPEVLVWELLTRDGGSLLPEELTGIFGVSRRAAQIRLSRMERRSIPVFSHREQRLLVRLRHLLP